MKCNFFTYLCFSLSTFYLLNSYSSVFYMHTPQHLDILRRRPLVFVNKCFTEILTNGGIGSINYVSFSRSLSPNKSFTWLSFHCYFLFYHILYNGSSIVNYSLNMWSISISSIRIFHDKIVRSILYEQI